MRLELYDALTALVQRLDAVGLNPCGSFAHDATVIRVDFWRADGSVGTAPVPMPLAVMPSILARRMVEARI